MRVLIATLVGLVAPLFVANVVYAVLPAEGRSALVGMVMIFMPLTAAAVATWLSDRKE